jgi:hypothetical protein
VVLHVSCHSVCLPCARQISVVFAFVVFRAADCYACEYLNLFLSLFVAYAYLPLQRCVLLLSFFFLGGGLLSACTALLTPFSFFFPSSFGFFLPCLFFVCISPTNVLVLFCMGDSLYLKCIIASTQTSFIIIIIVCNAGDGFLDSSPPVSL